MSQAKLNKDLNVRKLRLWVPDDMVPKDLKPEDPKAFCVRLVEHEMARGEADTSSDSNVECARDEEASDTNCPAGTVRYVVLEGDDAIQYARYVHEQVYRRALRLEGVSAIDVGFAANEEARTFRNWLALRLHVVKKLGTLELLRLGLPNVTCHLWDHRCNEKEAEEAASRTYDSKSRSLEGISFAINRTLRMVGTSIGEEFAQHPLAGGLEVLYRPVATEQDPEGTIPWSCKPKKGEEELWRVHIAGVPLDVIQAKYFPASGIFTDPLQTSKELSDDEALVTGRGRVNVVVGGVSLGNESGQAGTLGTVVWDRTDGTPCVLSNFHVLAGALPSRMGQRCYQPAIFDGGCAEDVIGSLKRWRLDEDGDMAIAELNGSRPYAPGEILGMWHPLSGLQKPKLNLEVRKWGRTTGFTQGFIDGLDLATNIDYGNGVFRFFKGQIHIAPLRAGEQFSQVGDSGSLVVVSRRFRATAQKFRECRDLLRKIVQTKKIPDLKKECKAGEAPQHICQLLGHEYQAPPVPEATELEKLERRLKRLGFDVEKELQRFEQRTYRKRRRAYFAVGMLFAGDTAGSPFGEFALASNLRTVQKKLQISLRPVFESRSSFRKLRPEPEDIRTAAAQRRQLLAPGAEGRDPRDGGPQPDPEPRTGSLGGGG